MSSRSLVGAKMLVKVSICALSFVRILTSWVTFAWRFTLSMLRVRFVGSRAELLKPVEIPQVQFLVNGDMPFELCQPSECGLGMS